MKKKSLMLLLSIPFVFALGGIAACEEEEVVCDHTYADELSSDEDYHWYAATCDHTDLRGDAEPHKDKDNDGVCDVCKYDADHEHTYEETLTSNETQHWYAAKCTHSVKKDAEDHDFGADGVCKDCGYSEEAGHQHTFKTVYSTSATQHWFDAKCGHDVAVKENHVDSDSNNVCDVCGYDYLDMLAVIEDVTSDNSAAAVNGGTVAYGFDGAVSANYTYAFNDNYTYVEKVEEYATTKAYYSIFDGDKLFAIVADSYDNVERNTYANSAEMDGVAFNLQFIDDMVYGVENAVNALFAYGKNAENTNIVYDYKDGYNAATQTYSFAYTVVIDDYYDRCYTVEVSFKAANDVITTANITVNEMSENDFVYYSKAQFMLKENATPYTVYNWAITQTVGARTAENLYKAEDYIISEFEVTDGTNTIANGETLNVMAGVYTTLEITGDDADFADKLAFNNVTYSGTYADLSMFGAFNNALSLTPNAAGNYTLTVATEAASVTINVVVEWAELTAIEAKGYDEYYEKVDVENVTVFTGSNYTFTASVNTGANPAYTATVTSANAANATLTQDGSDYVFTSNTAGEYTVVVKSTTDETITDTFTITVKAPPAIEDVLNGQWTWADDYDTLSYDVTFVPNDTTPAVDGTATFVLYQRTGNPYTGWNEIETTGVYSYTYDETNGFAWTKSSGDDINVTITVENYAVCVTFGPYGKQALTQKGAGSAVDYTQVTNKAYSAEGPNGTMYLFFDNGNIVITDVSSLSLIDGNNEYLMQASYSISDSGVITVGNWGDPVFGTAPCAFNSDSGSVSADLTTVQIFYTHPMNSMSMAIDFTVVA